MRLTKQLVVISRASETSDQLVGSVAAIVAPLHACDGYGRAPRYVCMRRPDSTVTLYATTQADSGIAGKAKVHDGCTN